MSSAALTVSNQPAPLSITETRRSAAQMIAQRSAIVEAMKSVMKENVDFGKVPGTDKPSLWKPGSEKILSMFNLAATPTAEDLSTPDTIRYRVHITITHVPTGNILGTGVGEASSAESKYQWRSVVCEEEWATTPEDRRRLKWKRGYGDKPAFSIRQVRADMEDVANTILKMAKKRAQIDAVLTVTAASDVFSQDVEDLIDAGFDPESSADARQQQTGSQAQSASMPTDLPRKQSAPAETHSQQPTQSQQQRPSTPQGTVTDLQGRRFWAVAMENHGDHRKIMDFLRNVIGVQKKDDIPAARYDEAMTWAKGQAN